MSIEVRAENTMSLASVKAIYDATRRAKQSADEAEGHAQSAQTSASSALTAAQNAQGSADAALVSLSNVEDVVGVLEWITAHGTMTANGSTALDPSKVYFIVDPTGDYVVGGTHYSIVSEPKAEDRTSYYTLSIDESVQNYVATHVVVDAEGLWLIPDAGGNKVLIATGAGSSYTTAGTYIIGKVNGVDTVFAKFAQDGIDIGESSKSHLNITNQALTLLDVWGETSFEIHDYRTGQDEVDESFVGDGTKTTFALIVKALNTSDMAVYVNGALVTTGITKTVNAVTFNTAPTNGSNIRVLYQSQFASGAKAYTIGKRKNATDKGEYSIALGYLVTASGDRSVAEGESTTATGQATHAEGSGTKATGAYSHAQNYHTRASGNYQTALGKFNVVDNTSAVIIGNGTADDARSNALTIDWNGDVNLKGQAKTSFKSSVAMGSYGSSQTTVPNFIEEVRFSSGCCGSVSIGTAYTKNNVTINTGWYNFMYIPHRSGGANGSASGDNCNYGNCFLFGMNNTNGRFVIRVSSSSIQEVAQLYSSIDRYTRSNAGTLDWSSTAEGDSKVIMKSALAFWNGAYSGTSSTLKYSANGEIIGTNTGIGKTTWTPTSGSSYSNYGGCYYEKYGRVVHVHVGVSGLTAGNATNIYTLPSGYRPSSPVYAHGTGGAWNNIGYLEISTAGVVTARSAGNYCGADITYLV